MRYTCQLCRSTTVVWDPRSRRFLCENASCATSYPPIECETISEDNVLKALNLGLFEGNVIQGWLDKAPLRRPTSLSPKAEFVS